MLVLALWRLVLIPRQVRAIGYAERDDDLLIRGGIFFQRDHGGPLRPHAVRGHRRGAGGTRAGAVHAEAAHGVRRQPTPRFPGCPPRKAHGCANSSPRAVKPGWPGCDRRRSAHRLRSRRRPTASGCGCTRRHRSCGAGWRWPPSGSSSAGTPSSGCCRAVPLVGRPDSPAGPPGWWPAAALVLVLAVLGFILSWYFTRYQVAEGLRPRQHRLPVQAAAPGPAGPGPGHRHRAAPAGEDLRACRTQVRGGGRRRVGRQARVPADGRCPAAAGHHPGAGLGCGPRSPGRPKQAAPEAPEQQVLSVPPSRLIGSLLLSEQSIFVVLGGVGVRGAVRGHGEPGLLPLPDPGGTGP